jgi:hypothetical protein
MTNVEFINETILVEIRLQPTGEVVPLAFIWRGRRYRVTGIGRQWQEDDAADQAWQFYLVQAGEADTFELHSNPATGQWLLSRAWRSRHMT